MTAYKKVKKLWRRNHLFICEEYPDFYAFAFSAKPIIPRTDYGGGFDIVNKETGELSQMSSAEIVMSGLECKEIDISIFDK